MQKQAYALVGRSYPSDDFALLYQRSEDARAHRRALMRSPAGRAMRAATGRGARWRSNREPVALPSRLRSA